MSRHPGDDFDDWLAALARLEHREDVELNGDSYRQLLSELGYDDAALARVEAAIEAELVRGRGFLDHGRLTDAITEFEKASTLAPWRVDILVLLAEGHVARWRAEGDSTDAQRGRHYARTVLARDPSITRAFELLNVLDGEQGGRDAVAGPAVPAPRKPRVLVMWASVALMLIGIVVAANLHGQSIPEAVETSGTPMSEEFAEGTPSNLQGQGGLSAGTHDLPVEWIGEADVEGLEADFTGSTIERAYERAIGRLRLRLKNRGDQRITLVEGRVEYVDAGGKVLSTKNVAVVNSAYAPLHQGDVAVWGSVSDYGPWETAFARFIVTRVTRQKGAGEAPPAKPMCVIWDVQKPPGADLRVGVRREGKQMFFGPEYDVVVENSGKADLRDVRLRFDHQDAAGKLIKDSAFMREQIVNASWHPTFGAGTRRLVHYSPRIDEAGQSRIARVCAHVVGLE